MTRRRFGLCAAFRSSFGGSRCCQAEPMIADVYWYNDCQHELSRGRVVVKCVGVRTRGRDCAEVCICGTAVAALAGLISPVDRIECPPEYCCPAYYPTHDSIMTHVMTYVYVRVSPMRNLGSLSYLALSPFVKGKLDRCDLSDLRRPV